MATTDERAKQKDYWAAHSDTTVEAMMLDSKASEIDKLERPEVREESEQQQQQDHAQLAGVDGGGVLPSSFSPLDTQCCCTGMQWIARVFVS